MDEDFPRTCTRLTQTAQEMQDPLMIFKETLFMQTEEDEPSCTETGTQAENMTQESSYTQTENPQQ